ELARQSSSDSSAEIVKGTASGVGMAFRMRSMFFLGSVNVTLSQAADESRFTVIQLKTPDKSPDSVQQFHDFSRDVVVTLSEERCAKIRARSYRMIPIIRKNAKVLAQAVAEQVGSQRVGDQIGTLIAGAISLINDGEITLEEARSWAKKVDLSEAREAEQASDEDSCFAAIMQAHIAVNTGRGTDRYTFAELVIAAAGLSATPGLDYDFAAKTIARHGVVYDELEKCIYVSNTHSEIARILRDTPWAGGWRRILARLPGAEPNGKSVRFAGVVSKSVSVPIGVLLR
ncbi:MAG: hypothetical protein ABIR91_02610, partial [Candidatus Saccharimonadales bacterium]